MSLTCCVESQIPAQTRRGPLGDRQAQSGTGRSDKLPAVEALEDFAAFRRRYAGPSSSTMSSTVSPKKACGASAARRTHLQVRLSDSRACNSDLLVT